MAHISPSFWQNTHWKFFREQCGEQTFVFEEQGAHALVIEKSPHVLKFWKKKVWEIQRGPFGNLEKTTSLLQKIFKTAQEKNIGRVRVFPPLGIENFWKTYSPLLSGNFEGVSTEKSPEIFPEHTLFLDLTVSEDEIFAQMKQGGRRNIRKAIKAGVDIFEEKNVENFWKILQETASRDGFTTNKKFVYEKMLKSYSSQKSVLLSAQDETGEVLASALFLVSEEMGIYYYGASSNQKRNLMAPYLLQWEGIKWAQKNGAKKYDFLGISPDSRSLHTHNTTENGGKTSPEHQLASVSQFKLKFGGERVISDTGIDFVL